jgi:hypothetical protein
MTKKTKTTSKKAFDLARDSVYVADPISELRICGGAGVLPDDEAGDLDTEPGPDVPVRDLKRLKRPLQASFVTNIGRDGVRVPILICKIDDVATVVAGKSRVRAARRANRARAAQSEGLPPMRIRCVMQRDASSVAILATMISENNARQDDDLADRIEKLKQYLAAGASEADAATSFNVQQSTIRGWLDYDDHATDETKRAVRDGRVQASTAAELAKIKDPDAQRVALEKVLGAPCVKQRSARAARALRHDANGTGNGRDGRGASTMTATDKKSQELLLAYLDRETRDVVKFSSYRFVASQPDTEIGEAVSVATQMRDQLAVGQDHPVISERDIGYWLGVREAVALIHGKHANTVSPALLRALEKAREPKGDTAAAPAAAAPTLEADADEADSDETDDAASAGVACQAMDTTDGANGTDEST